jgi:hypothetical protein
MSVSLESLNYVVNYVVLFSLFLCVKRWYGNSIHDVATIREFLIGFPFHLHGLLRCNVL